MKITKLILVLAFTCLAYLSPLHAALQTGEPAPSFSLPGMDGETHDLSDYKGKYVVLEWFNHGCPFVRKHYDSGNMQQLQENYTEKEVVWLMIVSSAPGKQGYLSPEDAKERYEKENAQATNLLLDPDGEVGRMYAAKATPHM